MGKRIKHKVQKVKSVSVRIVKTKTATYWNPLPYDNRNKFIPSSVDCLFHQEYYSREDAKSTLIVV